MRIETAASKCHYADTSCRAPTQNIIQVFFPSSMSKQDPSSRSSFALCAAGAAVGRLIHLEPLNGLGQLLPLPLAPVDVDEPKQRRRQPDQRAQEPERRAYVAGL